MELTIDWVSIVNLAGILNGIFVVFVILGIKKGRSATRYFLTALIVDLILIVFASILWTTNLYSILPHLFGLFPQFYFALGPLLFLYVMALTTPHYVFRIRYLLHFIPLVYSILSGIPFYLKSGEYKLTVYKNFLLEPSTRPILSLSLFLRFIHIAVYLVLTIKLLHRHNRQIRESFSSLERIRLGWVRTLVFAIASVLGSYIFFYVVTRSGTSFVRHIGRVFTVWEPLLVLYIGYKGLIQPEIFSDEGIQTGKKYLTSSLTSDMADSYLKGLLSHMETEKPYRQANITLGQLAEELSIQPRHLSQIINDKLHQNFYDFINRYRIEEAKQRLVDTKDPQKIIAIAFDVGFNSKSTFNAVFKSLVEITPSEYRRLNS